jgi:hypothetical protein
MQTKNPEGIRINVVENIVPIAIGRTDDLPEALRDALASD